jgi:hypothetical protein
MHVRLGVRPRTYADGYDRMGGRFSLIDSGPGGPTGPRAACRDSTPPGRRVRLAAPVAAALRLAYWITRGRCLRRWFSRRRPRPCWDRPALLPQRPGANPFGRRRSPILERSRHVRTLRGRRGGDGAHNEHAAAVPEGDASSTRPLTASRLLRTGHALCVRPWPPRLARRWSSSTLSPLRCNTSPWPPCRGAPDL